MLGGVQVPFECGLAGHSDADVVLHALCDALLGAAGLGDIGELFPDTDPQYAGADSGVLLHDVLERVAGVGLRPVNVDVIVHAERPKLSPHKAQIRQRVAELLGLPETHVGIKATTNEGMGAVGQGDAIACWAAVSLEPTRDIDD